MNTMDMTKSHPDARFWDRIAERYSRKPVPDQAAYEKKLSKTDGYLRPTDRVLEIGCGTGTTALHHAPRVAHTLATDISPGMIEIARDKASAARVENVTFEVSSIDDLDDTPGQYDVILAHSILHLLEDVPDTLRRLQRLLQPGGLLISNTQCIGDSVPLLRFVAPLGRAIGVLPRIAVFRERQFERWITDAGFELEERWQPKPRASLYIVARATGGTQPRPDHGQ